ncbi:MAG: AAA family ATPase [Burkholderiales bacterium]|nr:AAA family ATPase [Burkholderiales bacterium]
MIQADPPPHLHLLLAGTPMLAAARPRPPRPLARLDGALLAWLALEGSTPRARLAALLWPAHSVEAARNSLRQRLFKLRRQLGVELIAGGEMLALAAGVSHDLDDADSVLGDEDLGFGAEFDAWLAQQRERRRARLAQSLVELCEGAERVGDWPDAIAQAGELLALSPLSETAHARLIRLHYLAGDRSAALLAFDRCERVLKHEVGTAPGADTLALLRLVERAEGGAPRLPVPRTPAAMLRPPHLIGRAAAWRTLQEAWARGRPVLLSGEAGVGKTRLAGDFAAFQGAVISGARPGDERVAYAAISRLLRALPPQRLQALDTPLRRELARLLPELGEAPPPLRDDADRARFFNAASLAFEGLAIVFDDLHFADDASVELLQFVVAAAGTRWLLATRPAEGGPAAQAWRERWAAASDRERLPLEPLAEAAVVELLASLDLPGIDAARDAPALWRRSGGNPLFLLETLKSGWAPGADGAGVPARVGVQALVERRIARLSPQAVQLARCAALATPDFSIELAAHVLALRTIDLADPWAELEAAQVLADGAFAHDLIFEAALASVPQPVARALHAEIAAFLAARGGEPARLARHWTEAGRWTEAGAAWRDAAARSRQGGRALDAAAQFAQAAAAFERGGDAAGRFDALLQRAWLLSDEHHGSQAQDAASELQALARDEGQALAAQEVRLNLASNRYESTVVAAQAPAAMAVARRLGRADAELRLAMLGADALADLQRAGEAVDLLEPLAERARAQASTQLQFDYWSSLALARDYADRLHDALPAWAEARAVAQRAARQDMLWKAIASQASTLAKMGHVQRAAEQCGQACAIIDAIGERTLRAAQPRVIWAHRLRDLGRYTQALALLEEALEVFVAADVEVDIAGVEHRLAQLYQQLGQPERAMRLLQAERASLPPRLQTVRLMHRADLAHDLGRDGVAQIRRALALSPDPGDIYHRIASLFATRLLPPAEGEAMAAGVAVWAAARGRLGVALAAHVRAADGALAQGAAARAAPHVEAALHLARDHRPDSFYLPELWLVAGRVEAALGHVERAQAHWRTGAAWVLEAADVPAAFRASFLERNAVNRALTTLLR